MLQTLLSQLPPQSKVLDYGCFGWKLHALCPREDLEHHGCDIMLPDGKPEQAIFHQVDQAARRIPVEDDRFDLVVAAHVLEHVADPIALFGELARICKPGGRIYIETPSDRSAMVRSDADVESHSFFSFWDDPTHLRPWTPAALYRLAICHGCVPLQTAYLQSFKEWLLYPLKRIFCSTNRHALTESLWLAKGWACFSLIEKPADLKGQPGYKYLSLKDVPRGREHALALVRKKK